MSDLISRQAATRGCYDPKIRNADYHDFAQMIEKLPSAQPEPQWIPRSVKQPEKGLMLVTYKDGNVNILKQPNCGADMRGEEHVPDE